MINSNPLDQGKYFRNNTKELTKMWFECGQLQIRADQVLNEIVIHGFNINCSQKSHAEIVIILMQSIQLEFTNFQAASIYVSTKVYGQMKNSALF